MSRPTSISELATLIDADQARLFTATMFAACGAEYDWGSDHLGALSTGLAQVELPVGLALPEDECDDDAREYWLSIGGATLL